MRGADEVVKAVATGLVTLIVSLTVLQLQLGGRRRRRRRELLDELALLEKLDDWPLYRARARARVEELLERQLPGEPLPDDAMEAAIAEEGVGSVRNEAKAVLVVVTVLILMVF